MRYYSASSPPRGAGLPLLPRSARALSLFPLSPSLALTTSLHTRTSHHLNYSATMLHPRLAALCVPPVPLSRASQQSADPSPHAPFSPPPAPPSPSSAASTPASPTSVPSRATAGPSPSSSSARAVGSEVRGPDNRQVGERRSSLAPRRHLVAQAHPADPLARSCRIRPIHSPRSPRRRTSRFPALYSRSLFSRALLSRRQCPSQPLKNATSRFSTYYLRLEPAVEREKRERERVKEPSSEASPV